MYPPTLAPSTHELGPLAEEVRAHLVEARGGAPFLSAADGQLLLDWLDSGVPVPLILAAIDRVVIRRRKKRVRSRLTLKACKGEVAKALKKQAARNTQGALLAEASCAPVPDGAPSHASALHGLIEELECVEVASEMRQAWRTLLSDLRELAEEAPALEQATVRAIGAARDFQREAWSAMAAHHPSLRQAARVELAHLEGAVSERIFLELLEETARDQLRRRFPLVSADQLWDRLQP